MIEIETTDEEETRELGRRIGAFLESGSVIALDGTLGAGKTRLTQGIGVGLGIPSDAIVSPTYTLCVPYSGRLPLIHLDAYRIKDTCEVDELGLDELVEEGAVLVIEWASRIERFLPPSDIQIVIDLTVADTRIFRIQTNDRYSVAIEKLRATDARSDNLG